MTIMATGAATVGRERTVSDTIFAVDPRLPLFFVSYAHTPSSHDSVLEFFEDLSNHVRELVGRGPGADPGFLDRRSLTGGRPWTPELLRAVGACQVFIPLISTSLFESTWCGYEWDAFSRRQVVNRATRLPDLETAILPVIWASVDPEREPKAVKRIQRFTPTGLPTSVVKMYEEEGIYGLRILDMDAYQAVVWRLAQRVVGLTRTYLVHPMTITDADQLRNVFTEEGA